MHVTVPPKFLAQPTGHLVVELGPSGQPCVFGRAPTCEVVLEHPSLSRAHAQLTRDAGGRVFLTDLDSCERGGLGSQRHVLVG